MSHSKYFLILAIIFSGAVLAQELPGEPCAQPVNPENRCMKFLDKTYHGVLKSTDSKEKLDITLHFDKAACAFTDSNHPNRDIFHMEGQINDLKFSKGNSSYRTCVTNSDKQLYGMTLYTDTKDTDNDFKLYFLHDTDEACQVQPVQDELCVEVVNAKKQHFKGELQVTGTR